ncbi:hypothetical protein X737_35500 [Mesorhizobium sp. L48C026A00]|nr:hypothetical protein X737_35500 [Mesorhizobium sp. L48C026A00]
MDLSTLRTFHRLRFVRPFSCGRWRGTGGAGIRPA